jgi:cell division protein FtsL
MASDVLYGQSVLKPYFNMQKFEDAIYNRPKIKMARIKKRKLIHVLDKLMIVVATLLFIVFISYMIAAAFVQARIYGKNNDIKKLTNTLNMKVSENYVKIDAIKSEIKFEELKMKAYMEFNMITPTEKNIIYFDKTDSGFVRQYENIR